jgi:hypothetical protein
LLSAVFSVLATTILELQSAALEKEKSMQKWQSNEPGTEYI